MSARGGRAWAYAAAGLGAVVSVAANVGHSFVPPAGAASSWRPHAGAVLLAAFWPVALLLAVEVLARVPWPPERRWALMRWGGLVPVAAVAAVVSYRHLSGLLGYYGEDPITTLIGPAGVDGLMVVATGALLATAGRGRPAVAVEAVEAAPVEPVPAEAAEAVSASAPRPPRRPAPRTQPPVRADVDDLLLVGQAVAGELEHRGEPLTRDTLLAGLRARGHGVSTTRAGELLRALRGAA